jgi:4-carboxymuconolactone decarboxylase
VRAPLLAVAAALGARDPAALDRALRRAASEADPAQVEELLLQSHLFVGFPDALNALAAWREASGRAAPPALGEDPAAWTARGERVCARVYGGTYERLRVHIRALHPEIDDWMLTGGYGRVLGRPGLGLVDRELCVVALLAAWGAPRQLRAHLRGALNAGASEADLDEAVAAGCAGLPPRRVEEVRRLRTGVGTIVTERERETSRVP